MLVTAKSLLATKSAIVFTAILTCMQKFYRYSLIVVDPASFREKERKTSIP